MIIKLPKKTAIFAGVAALLIIALGLGVKSSREKPLVISTPKSSIQSQTLPQGKIREIQVTAKQFEFTPNPIKVALGENVRLKIKSIDVTHGFSLPEFGINQVLNPGRPVTVEFQATKKGEFPFLCSVVCGTGHTGMRGSLIIE